MKLGFILDENQKYIIDYLVPAKDMMQSFQEAIFDDDVFYPDKIQGYKIEYRDLIPHASFSDELWQEYQNKLDQEAKKEESQAVFDDLAKSYTLEYASDEDAYKMRYLYPDFDPNGHEYKQNDRFLWSENNKFYKVLQNHTSQADWTPDTAVSLYVEIPDPSVEWPEWKQPTGAHDAYSIGDKVSYNKEHYISQINGNTTVPGSDERWWKKVAETVEEPDPEEPSEPEEPVQEEYPSYVQPTGAHDAYYKGNKVTFEGAKYICIAPEGVAVVWDPATYPAYWQEVKADDQ